MSRLVNKVAVITGGNSGIGLAIAKKFTEQDADVIIFGRNRETLDKAMANIGNGTVAVQGDVRNTKDLDSLFLASDDSSCINDADIAADAGMAQV